MAGGSFPMNGGDGPHSYTKNSQFQKQASDSVKGMIQGAIIEKLDIEILLSISSTLRIADFGCSVGPNTFFAMQNLIKTVERKCSLQGLDSKNMEFQVFFNDHTANDFNTLFASLPIDKHYHSAGVPGSFYGRLFPRASICLAYSSYALQWLSRVPEGVSDSKSMAWNGGRIHYGGASRDVVNAYFDQFQKDMGVFLSARAEEIVTGGLMLLIVPGIPEGVCLSRLPTGINLNYIGSSLMDLGNEGIVDKTKIEAFNLPLYLPTVGEMTKIIEKNGCFSIERIELTNLGPQVSVHSAMITNRAVMGEFLTKHFGNSVVEKMFSKILAKPEEILLSPCVEAGNPNVTQLFVVLKRK